ncbi:hypothetical protein F9Z36_2053 [Neisseria gonorrhoeae]|nr:hypothetical protein F9Z36_2053 [Neisseria gonorrhoeae]
MPSEGKPAFRRHTVHDKAAHHDRTKNKASLIEFPCAFPLKVMGAVHPEFEQAVLDTVRLHAPDTQAHHITTRPSSKGNYTGATVQVKVENQEQLDNIYRALTSHELVKVVL